MLLQKMTQQHTRPQEYQIKILGGGNMFPQYKGNYSRTNCNNIGSRNIEAARLLLKKHGFPLPTEHVGGEGFRKLIFNLWDGDVWVKHVKECKEPVGVLAGGWQFQPAPGAIINGALQP